MEAREGNLSLLRDGLEELRRGSLYVIIAFVIVLAGSVASALLAYAYVMGGAAHGASVSPHRVLSVAASLLVPVGIAYIVAAVLGVLAWLKWKHASDLLSEYDGKYRVGSTGALLVMIGFVILLLAGVGLAASTATPPMLMVGLMLVLLAAVLVLVGGILFSLMLMRMGDLSGTLKTAGIIMLIAAILMLIHASIGALLYIVSVILVYMGCGDALQRLGASS